VLSLVTSSHQRLLEVRRGSVWRWWQSMMLGMGLPVRRQRGGLCPHLP